MVASWVGKTTRAVDFLSPGAECDVRLLPEDQYGVGARRRHRPDDKKQKEEYQYHKGGESRYIESFGSMKDYTNANKDHHKRVAAMGFEQTTTNFIPNLPLYRYEIAKFRWRPAPNKPQEDGYYEGSARIRKLDGTYTYVRVSLLTETMVKLFGPEADSAYIRALKTKAKDNTLPAQYRFVNIPPGDSREELRVEKRAIALQALVEAEAEERKQAALHPTKRAKQATPLVTQAQATLLAVDAPPPQALCTTIPIKYRQTEALTCLIDSFCSAIWAFGLCDAAEGLQRVHRMKLTQSNARLIGDWVEITNQQYLHERQLVIRKLPHLRHVDQVLAWDTAWPLVVLLASSDGGVGQHSVTIYEDGIYEPNAPFALTKSRGSLDWAAGLDCTCLGITKAYQIVPKNIGSLTDGPPPIYNLEGCGRVWVQKRAPTYAQVRLFSGERIKVEDKAFLDEIA
jgi:hypothetical protein